MTTTVALESLDHQSGPCIPLDVQTDDLLSRLLPAGGALAKMRPTEVAAGAEMGLRGFNGGCPGCWLDLFKPV